jgi:hypothetical protein
MIPETGGAKDVRLYETNNFPFDWKVKSVLLKDRILADATLIIKNGVFYLLSLDIEKNAMCLFYSYELENNWLEHPQSPVRTDNIRCGGSPITIDNHLYYFIQDHTDGYGTGLHTYEIDSISPTFFADHKLDNKPLLWRFGDGWASAGMHQFSAIQLKDGSYFCVVDGCQNHGKYWGWDWLNFPKFRLK